MRFPVPPGNPEAEREAEAGDEKKIQRQGQAKSEKGMKDSERVQEKCQTVSQRRGEGPSAATQESRSQPWLCSQGEHGPLLGSWRKEEQFPGAGSDRNTTPLRSPRDRP